MADTLTLAAELLLRSDEDIPLPVPPGYGSGGVMDALGLHLMTAVFTSLGLPNID